MHEQLVELCTLVSGITGTSRFALTQAAFELHEKKKFSYGLLSSLSTEKLYQQYDFIRHLTTVVASVLPLVDLTGATQEWCTIASRISRVRSMLLLDKNVIVSAAFAQVACEPSVGRVRLSTLRAKVNRGHYFVGGGNTLFDQMSAQLQSLDPSQLRCFQVRPFELQLDKQLNRATFSAAFKLVCDELMSPALPLFTLCPNGLYNVGQNRESFVVNPKAAGKRELESFEFVGKILAMSLLAERPLCTSLLLPSLFWKYLCGQGVGSQQDLLETDANFAAVLLRLKTIHTKPGMTEDGFADMFNLHWSVRSSTGSEIDLVDHGAKMTVQLVDLPHFLDRVLAVRMAETSTQMEAILRGLSSVVPAAVLRLYCWNELQARVCGDQPIDVQLLRDTARYDGIESTEAFVGLFWDVLAQFTSREKRLFLQFAGGRSRLPPPDSPYFVPLTIRLLRQDDYVGNFDTLLPSAHTRFFMVDMPPYSTFEACRAKLLYAITHSVNPYANVEGMEDM
eukprot:gnl/Hemi2/28838_TR9565_c0_g3_i1.p1 gnl/Hemi2/28838_TR9565_c0_g3~~gnl/Hemi2/28838_TR9565_c0_g3_i1.p1  ORF type:complete len:508 (+),score=157.51 gnl/Hemi2/28838_TR9565_c0_g3_i1:273-1796(+)